MWIQQRTGENTSVIAPVWAYPVGLIMLLGLVGQVVEQVWPLLLGAAVIAGGVFALYWWAEARRHKAHTNKPLDVCKLCQRDARRLAALEEMAIAREEARKRRELEAAEVARLRNKYRA